jgi:hypothetical protein
MVLHMAAALDILKAAQTALPKDSLDSHLATVETLRDKGYTWRDIAAFLTERQRTCRRADGLSRGAGLESPKPVACSTGAEFVKTPEQ